jgi:hypothetical protein|tara:strand:- start:449 stop:745 length:297 start_codon:yes stop_codon:yes gene_type:complete
MKQSIKKYPKFKDIKQHPDAKKPRDIVRFYNDPTLANKLSHGYHHFEIGDIGWKWVKIRPTYLSTHRANHWTKIKRSKWDDIQQLKSFRVLEEKQLKS